MEEMEHEKIFTDSGVPISGKETKTWIPLMRQCIICIVVWYVYFMQGLYLGAPTVLIAQIRREANSTEAVTNEMSSWLSSTPAISSVPMIFILPWLFHRRGRRLTLLIVYIMIIISFIIFYNSSNLYHILISEIFIGGSVATVNSFGPVIIAEYTSPEYRGIFLTMKSVTVFWGIWVANVIGTFFHWKNIAIVSFVCSFYVFTVITWPESPYWLAMKGRYVDCAKSHRWLKGVNVNSEKELAQLILSHQQHRNRLLLPGDSDTSWCFLRLSRIRSIIMSHSFYKPTLICIFLFAQFHLSGKFVMSIYAIEVLKNLTQDESVVYKGMLILDGITVFSMYLGCILSRYCKRRILLFSFAGIGNVCLYVLSFYLYLVSLSLIVEIHIIIIFLLSVFSIAIGCGPTILTSSIYGEIIPVHYEIPIMTISGLCGVLIMSTLLKISPFMFKALKMYGCFLFFAVSTTFIIIILYIYLPETKDKTIQEIEKCFSEKQSSQHQKRLLKIEELNE